MRQSSPIIGTLIAGKYRVERVLGQGGMGLVVEAMHVTLGTRVAVKILRADIADADVRERFSREGQIAAQLAGEHIARVTDTGQNEEGDPYLVMEFLVGRDLSAELEARRRLPIAEAVDLVLQACEGVAEAHAVGLVHRDLKPANLFLVRRRDGSPLVKVLDFGLSKILNSQARHLTATTSSFGTPQYMSPEQIASSKYVDAHTDQHALSMILYELITGVPPYEAPSVPALFVTIATMPPAPMRRLRPEVDSMLDATVLKALSKAPKDRFANLSEFAASLAPFGSAEGMSSVKRIGVTLGRPIDEPSVSNGSISTCAPVVAPPPAPHASPPPIERLVSDDQSATLKKVPAPYHAGPFADATTAVVEPDTHSPLESDPYASRGKSRRMVAIGSALAMAGLGAIILAYVFSAPDPVVDTPHVAASSSELPAPSAPEITPGGTAVLPAVTSSSASAPALSASAASSAKSNRPPLLKSSAGPAGDEALKVFGVKRKQ